MSFFKNNILSNFKCYFKLSNNNNINIKNIIIFK